jgi:hypothetical protein
LENYPHYELALLDQAPEENRLKIFWEIVGQSALFQVEEEIPLTPISPYSETDRSYLYLSTQEPTIVRAMRASFMERWNNLTPDEKDKSRVIAYLRSLLT